MAPILAEALGEIYANGETGSVDKDTYGMKPQELADLLNNLRIKHDKLAIFCPAG